ncbi:glycosyltransferase, putative [Medicago truncatula]|uniref:Glycosyltransferase, putative n=1 Tax=Medicago truncatula TaxID=3880 RepID=G7KHK0_MEDTR|nr:glycosyltransferase, putative [Medicago truncatula]
MNAALLSDGLKVAIRPKVNENGIVEREEIAKVVKNLMVGEEGKEIHPKNGKVERIFLKRLTHMDDYHSLIVGILGY